MATAQGTQVRAAAYVRISFDRDGREVGVKRQEADCRKFAELREWPLVRVYADNDRSAWSGKPRPEFQRLMADIRSGAVNAVIVYHQARLTRDVTELEAFIKLHKDTGVLVATTNGQLDLVSASGKMSARMQGVFAAGESDLISERVSRALLSKATEGRPQGGVRPFGFMPDRITHDEHEAQVIQEVAAAILSGASLRSQVNLLNARGDLTPQAGKARKARATGEAKDGAPQGTWDLSTLSRMLLRPRLIGKREHRGALYPAVWKPILSEADQIALRAILTDPRRSGHKGAQPRHLLSGLLYCGVCGSKMRFTGGRSPQYHCPSKPRGNNCVSVIADAIEQHVIARYLGWYGSFRDDDAVVDDTVSTLRDRLTSAAEAFARGDLELEQLTVITRDTKSRIAEAERAIGATAIVRGAVRARDRWPALDTDERRSVLLARFGKVIVHRANRTRVFDPERVEFTGMEDTQPDVA